MTGCRYGAKNTLLKNYLGLAESAGAQVIPMTTVKGFEQRSDGLWEVRTVRTGSWLRRDQRTFTASHVILAAGTWGTQHLLFKMRDKGKLPRLSKRLGVLTRTNSESIVGAGRLNGLAGSGLDPRRGDHVVDSPDVGHPHRTLSLRQGLQRDGAAADPDDRRLRVRRAPMCRGGSSCWTTPARIRGNMLRLLNPRQWSERTMIALVMQHLDNSITTFTKRGKLGIRWFSSKQGHGEPNPTWIPVGNEVTRRIAAKIDGVAGGTWGELFNIPLTAHFLGGAVIGDSPEHGVIDPYHRVYGYPTLLGGGRRRDLGEPGRQPVAVHHRASRAGCLAVAEQGRERPAAAAGRRLPAAGADHASAPGGAPRCTGCAALVADRSGQLSELTGDQLARLPGRAAQHAAAFPVHVDRDIAHQRDAVHQARLVVVVVDGPVLGRPVVPDGDVAGLPVPPNSVLRHR